MTATDRELLGQYLEGSDQAFAELVRRHLDMVFSAARRQTQSRTQAEEVTQSVFIHLARDARRIAPGTPLPAWLHLVTRHTAIDAAKKEARRQAREQVAFEISAMNSSSPDWTRIEPFLDEAVAALPTDDQAALVLRFFEDKSLREVGQNLGISEEAARKRVSRALEQLRSFCGRRGVAVSAAGLAANLSARAIESAPAGLAASVTTVASLCGTALQPPIVAVVGTLTMTTLQKTLAVAALAALLSGGLYEARVLSRQSEQVRTLERQAAELNTQRQQAQREREAALAHAKALEAAAAAAAVVAPTELAATSAATSQVAFSSLSLAEKKQRLKQLFADRPGSWIPELNLLSDADWDMMLGRFTELETDEEIRAALASLRSAAKSRFSNLLLSALRDYRSKTGSAPSDLAQLADYFQQFIDPAIFDRYATNPADFHPLARSNALVAEKLSAISDPDYDTLMQLFPFNNAVVQGISPARNATNPMYAALNRFAEASGKLGATPENADQLRPYLPASVPPGAVEQFLADLRAKRAAGNSPGSMSPLSPGGGEKK